MALPWSVMRLGRSDGAGLVRSSLARWRSGGWIVIVATRIVGAIALVALIPPVGIDRVDLLGEYPHDDIPAMSFGLLNQGKLAMVHGEGSWPAPRRIYYQEMDIDGVLSSVVVVERVGSIADALLIVDSSFEPHVLVDSMIYDGGHRRQVLEYERDGDDWTSTVAFDSTDSNAMLVAAAVGSDDTMHAIMCYRSEARFHHAWRNSGAWQWEEISQGADERHVGKIALAVDASGGLHIVYDVANECANPPFRPELRYLRNLGAGWQREVVLPQANTALSLHVDPSILIASDNAPFVASTFGETAGSGSLLYSELRLSQRSPTGNWSSETVADQSDGFAAGDGSQFTGWRPQLLVGQEGMRQILFSDMACWHEPSSQYCQRGQVRLAVESGAGWNLQTLYPQTVRTQSYLDRMRLEKAINAPEVGRLFVVFLEGDPNNLAWSGSFSRLRAHVVGDRVFEDGFESGDTTSWSESVN